MTPEFLDTLKTLSGILVPMLMSAVTVLGILWRGANWIKDEFAKRDAAIVKTSEQASLVAQSANERSRMVEDQLRNELAEHRLHAAETFATKSGLKESLDRVHDAVDRLTNRIDIVLNGSPGTPRPPRRRAGE